VPEVGITHNPQGQATANVVGPDDKVSVRVVTASRTIGDKWVIDAGLNAGDRVIVAGIQKIQPGGTVKPVEQEQPAAPAAASQQAAASDAAATQKAQ